MLQSGEDAGWVGVAQTLAGPLAARGSGDVPRMDQDFHLDLDDVRRNIEAAEVVSLYFPYFRKTLLIDSRCSRVDPPMARVVDMVRSADERLEALRRLRPRFGRPKAITLIPWPRFVVSAKESGMWQ